MEREFDNICNCEDKCTCTTMWHKNVISGRQTLIYIPQGFIKVDVTRRGDLVYLPKFGRFKHPEGIGPGIKYICAIRRSAGTHIEKLVKIAMISPK